MIKNTTSFLAFDEAWFTRHQRVLLWFLNAPVIKYWARWIMRIRKHDQPINQRIYGIFPNRFIKNIKIDNSVKGGGNYCLTVDFRSHLKYSKRMYFAFKYVWWVMHIWDMVFADRLAPALSFGFATLTAYPDPDVETSTVDGRTARELADALRESWATFQPAAGNTAVDNGASGVVIQIWAGSTSNTWIKMTRSIHLFDTSSLTAAATISAAVMSLFGTGKNDFLSITPNIDVYVSAPATNVALVAADYTTLGTTSQTGSPITYANWSTSAYNDFTLDATGRGNVSKTSITKFGVRNANYDVANVQPAWVDGAASDISAYFADQTGTTNDPKLVVTYTLPASFIPKVLFV